MATIQTNNYITIAQLYTDASLQVAGVADYYFLAAYEVVILQTFDPELDLLLPFFNAYLAAQNVFTNPPQAVISAIKSLQIHVLDKARTDVAQSLSTDTYPTAGLRFKKIDDWLDAGDTNNVLQSGDGAAGNPVGRSLDQAQGSILVEARFATVSDSAGFTIAAGNII